jgi:hypothetical protein
LNKNLRTADCKTTKLTTEWSCFVFVVVAVAVVAAAVVVDVDYDDDDDRNVRSWWSGWVMA